jgi:hypothetical protein
MPPTKRTHDHGADAPPARSTRSHAKGASQGASQGVQARGKRRKKDGEEAAARALERARVNAEKVLQDTRKMADNEKRRQQRATKKKKEDNAAKETQKKAEKAAKNAEDMRRRAEAARRRRQAMQPALDTPVSEDNSFSRPQIVIESSSPDPTSPSLPRLDAMMLPTTPTGNAVTQNLYIAYKIASRCLHTCF